MKLILPVLLAGSGVFAQDEHGDPYEPVGSLTVSPVVVQPGVHPNMEWGIEYPEDIDDLVDVGDNDELTAKKDLTMKVRVAGVAFQSGNTQLNVAHWVRIGGSSANWELVFYGKSYHVNPAEIVLEREVPAGTRIDFAGRGRSSGGSWYSTRWTVYDMEEVIGLKNGDLVPDYAPAYNQGRIEDFLTQFISDDLHVILGPRDMIYLFELYSTTPGDYYFDMQDLVSVITFEDPALDPGDIGGSHLYANFIRQIQRDSGVEWDLTVDPAGASLSQEGVSTEGSFFQLWSIHTNLATEYLLDEQFVTSYTPNAVMAITTGDPYVPVPRTRVDQPFSVQVDVSGLLEPGADIPLAATQVALSHEVFLYPEGQHSPGGGDPDGTLIQQGYIEDNGESVLSYTVTNLPAGNLTSAEGEEVFTVSALEDFGVSATVLDSKRVQIWPMATGSVSGFDPAAYYEDVPPLTVTLSDLYPSSTTYLRTYPGGSQSNPGEVTIIPASYVVINDSIPQDRSIHLEDVDSYFTKEGPHTLEILHETPFGTDLLYSSSIRVDRTIEMTGSLNVSR